MEMSRDERDPPPNPPVPHDVTTTRAPLARQSPHQPVTHPARPATTHQLPPWMVSESRALESLVCESKHDEDPATTTLSCDDRPHKPAAVAHPARVTTTHQLPPWMISESRAICESKNDEDRVMSEPSNAALNFDDGLAIHIAAGVGSKSRTPYTKWHMDHHKARMDEAVKAFMALPETPESGKGHRGGMAPGKFIKSFAPGIPSSSFRDRLASEDPLSHRKIGRRTLLSREEQRAVADSVARRDDLNAAKDTHAILTALHQTFPEYTRKQLSNHWHHVLKNDPALSGRVKGDASSLARSAAVNEFAQRAWFLTVKRVRDTLIRLSLGTYKGKTYKELQKHFIIGSDEEGVQASYNGTHLVGRKGKKVHLYNSDDCRTSGTALRTGSAFGSKGPSMYVLGGVKAESYIDTKFLEAHGAPRGSIYTCNSAAYMTNATWDENVEAFATALRKIDDVVEANPDWWIEWHVDGFKSKVNTAKGQEVMREYRLAIVQSPGHASHVNQVRVLCRLMYTFVSKGGQLGIRRCTCQSF